MKKIAVLLLFVFILAGCSFDGNAYVKITPRNERTDGNTTGAAPAENYYQLRSALQAIVASGTENGIIYTVNMDDNSLSRYMVSACRYVQDEDAIGAYAVDSVAYEIGTTGGKTAVACTVAYRHSTIEIRKILHLENMEQMHEAILEALENCENGSVVYVEDYKQTDIAQLVQDIARTNPHVVMEIPDVAEEVYGIGSSRVIELLFNYENSRESLRQMQSQVRPVFDSAALYVSGEGSDFQKFTQLYAFLMERFNYTIETSITPSYSLLRHGVGDSRAFATVYAAMCRNAGLDCQVVTGTRMGEPWTWNIIQDTGRYYHIDLLNSANNNYFWEMLDSDMNGYVWDYSAYPQCLGMEPVQETGSSEPEEIE